MAKVTLTIEDLDNGDTRLTLESDPPFDMEGGSEPSDAQIAGMIALQSVNDAATHVDVGE